MNDKKKKKAGGPAVSGDWGKHASKFPEKT